MHSKACATLTATLAVIGMFGILEAPNRAHAIPDELSIRAEAAMGLHLTEPQLTYFPVGLGFAGGAELLPDPMVGIEARFSMYFFPSAGAVPIQDDVGTAFMPGLAFRLHPIPESEDGDLWFSLGVDIAMTGDQVFPALGIGAGYDFEIDTMIRMGPFVRYQHIFDVRGLDGLDEAADAGFLQIGLSISLLGKEPERPRPPVTWEPNGSPLQSGGWHEDEPFEHECEEDRDCEDGLECRQMRLGTCTNCPRGEDARICVDPDHPGEGADSQ